MYTVRLKINTNYQDDIFFAKCFYISWKINNEVIRYVNQQIYELERDRRYQILRSKYRNNYSGKNNLTKDEKRKKKKLTESLISIQREYKLDRSGLFSYVKTIRNKYNNYLTSQQGQWIAKKVLRSLEKYLYSNGNRIHYKKLVDINSLGQFNNLNGIKLKSWNEIEFLKKRYTLKILKNNSYINEIVSRPRTIKLCTLKRIEFNSGYKYYVIVTVDGIPPVRYKKSSEKNVTGIDLGTSSIAAVSNKEVYLDNLAVESIKYERKIKHLQKVLDNKIRINNPYNYNKDGTVKKGSKKWKNSKSIKRIKREIRVLYRKETAYIHTSHREQLNKILSRSSEIIIEPMVFRGLQKRSKVTERQEDESIIITKEGSKKTIRKYKRKKRWGHSIKNHSPGYFQEELKRKSILMDIPYYEIDRNKYKASQLNHETGEYIKSTLKDRYKEIGGYQVQRDLYSAYLIMETDNTLTKPDFKRCNKDFNKFVINMNKRLKYMKDNNISNKGCWGF